ncbi:MAG: aminotransferase class I/II-fold pyridoxal phosphate-dependent enzyme [Acidimicrobiales bacterium]|nr:aminotransferase class I/II-fold pyridoxal phosphate-dependent enzyme [Acidimicrobiales bacterium]
MRYSSLVDRLYNDGAAGWDVHMAAWRAQARGEDVIVLSVGDPDFDTPAPIVDAAVDALRSGDTHYGPIIGRPELRAAVAADMSARTGLSLGGENVMICAGTQNGLLAAAMCLLDAGDEVIGLDPMYLTYQSTLGVTGADIVRVAQPAAGGFRPDAAAIEAAVTARTRAVVITTPNNPTGVAMTRAELEAIAEIALRHDLWVVSDEVYSDVIFEGEHVSIASLDGMAERTVTVGSLSKSHAMTGWRCGWAVAPVSLVRHFDALQVNVNYGIPGFVQAAALAALTEYREAFRPMVDAYKRRRDLAAQVLADAPDLPVLVPDAGMYLLADVRAHTDSVRRFVRELFDATGVSVIDASAFGDSCRGWIRLSFTLSDDALVDGCTRLVDFLKSR